MKRLFVIFATALALLVPLVTGRPQPASALALAAGVHNDAAVAASRFVADPQPPNPQPPGGNPGPQPSAPTPTPANIKQSWDGSKGAMTFSWDPITQPLHTFWYYCTDVSASSTCSNSQPLDFPNKFFAEGTEAANSDQPRGQTTHFTMTGLNATDYYVWRLCAEGQTGIQACSPDSVLNNGAHFPDYGDCTNCPGFWTTPGPNGCNREDLTDYFVLRWAYPGDTVCVDPSRLTQVLADNAQAAARRSPTGGAYGPNTCISGYVWRVAKPDDLVCVTPDERDRIAAENANPNPQHQ